jgi:hypothetical protein
MLDHEELSRYKTLTGFDYVEPFPLISTDVSKLVRNLAAQRRGDSLAMSSWWQYEVKEGNFKRDYVRICDILKQNIKEIREKQAALRADVEKEAEFLFLDGPAEPCFIVRID